MQTDFIPGPYSLAGTQPIAIEGKEALPGMLRRDNDGSLIIMAPADPDEHASDRKRIAAVGLTIDVKRGTGWKVTAEEDPVQMATARLFLAAPDVLESAEVYLTARDEMREFESEHPNDATHRWDDKLMAIELAENALRAAVAKARGQ